MIAKSRKKPRTAEEYDDAVLAKELRPLTRLLLQITSDLDWGEKFDKGPVHVNCKDMMLRYMQGRCCFQYPKKLTQKALRQHFRGERTLYFSGSRGDQSLVYIDPDCHKSGTKEGAFQFLEFLKNKYFPNLYYEASTHGNGGSGYIIVNRSTCSDHDFNALLKQLDKFLKRVLATTTFDVEDVEVKGTCPEITKDAKDWRFVENMKCGGLAKFPREMITRGNEFLNTTRITTDQLQAIVDSPLQEVPSSVPLPNAAKRPRGSIRGKHIDPKRIERLMPYAEEIMGGGVHQVGNKTTATVMDCAIFLTLLVFFTLNPNEDHSLPYKRFKALWDALYECGDISRAWDNKRFAYLRNLLSDLGLIQWVDNTYDPSGGRAMKWCASAELMAKLQAEKGQNEQTTADEAHISSSGRILGGKWVHELKTKMQGKPIIRPKMVRHIIQLWEFGEDETLEEALKRIRGVAS